MQLKKVTVICNLFYFIIVYCMSGHFQAGIIKKGGASEKDAEKKI